jgi:transcriptional regulator with XRE-family HTH domain
VAERRATESGVEPIGARLKRLRLARGLSQRELSSPGVSYAYISRIEAGARHPSVKALRQLAPKLGVSVEYLETGREIGDDDARELRLGEAELKLRLEDDLAAAEAEFSAIAAEAVAAADENAYTRARLGLGEIAARRGEFRNAIAELEPALASPSVSPAAHADVFATLARAYAAAGRPDRAVSLLAECLEHVRASDPVDQAAEIRYSTYLSYALSDLGEFESARAIVSEVLARAGEEADPYSRIRLYWSLARLALLDDKPRVALRQIQKAIALLEATEDTRQLGRAHLSCGEILIDAGRPEEARRHLDLAETLLGAGGDAADRGWLLSEQARQAVRVDDPARAQRLAEAALEVLKDGDALKRGRAYATLGDVTEDLDEAAAQFARAVELLESGRYWREAAAVCREWAVRLRRVGRESEAADVLERAAGFVSSGAAAVGRAARVPR